MGMAGIQCNNSSSQSLELVQPGLSRGWVLSRPSLCRASLCTWDSGAHFFTSVLDGPGLRSHLLSAVVQSEHEGSPHTSGLPPPDAHPSAAVRGGTKPPR